MKIFILEDNFERIKLFEKWLIAHEFYVTDNVEVAKHAVEEFGPFDLYLIDHDLDNRVFVNSDEENTGYQFAKFLAEKKIQAKFVTHSLNVPGAINICGVLKGCQHISFLIIQEYLIKLIAGKK